MKLDTSSKRAGIYLIYDKDGIVSDYILYQLKDLIQNLEYILVVVNGKLTPNSRKQLLKYTKHILVRENSGFDIAGYREGIEHIGWENIYKYDELLLMNDSCYGPIYPFKVVFDKMNNLDVDFWGLTMGKRLDITSIGKGKDIVTLKDGYVPVHIQSYFRCIRKSLLCDNSFKDFWETQKDIKTFWEAVAYHEIVFTKEFENKGFSWAVYVDSEEYKNWTCSSMDYIPYLLLKDGGLPLIKRKNFFRDYEDSLRDGTPDQYLQIIKYLSKRSKYDVNMIWNDVLRVRNMTEVHRKIRLNYILPLERELFVSNENRTKVAILLLLTSKMMIHYILEKLSLLNTIDIYIFTYNTELYEFLMNKIDDSLTNIRLQLISSRNNVLSTFLIESKEIFNNYEFVCYLNDKPDNELDTQSNLFWVYNCIENLIGSEIYIKNIIELFGENKKLGLLFPPMPSNTFTYNIVGDEWRNSYEKVSDLCQKLSLNVSISQSEGIIYPFGNMFWCRTDALLQMYRYSWNFNDYSNKEFSLSKREICLALERMYSLFAQSSGYLSGWILNDIYANTQISDMYYSQRNLIMNKQEYVSSEEIVKMYENSTSWKITYPIRMIGKFLHYFKKCK